jgi:hypothetical protein
VGRHGITRQFLGAGNGYLNVAFDFPIVTADNFAGSDVANPCYRRTFPFFAPSAARNPHFPPGI